LNHRLACAAIAALSFALPIAAQSDWTPYGHDAGQTKYSPLDQINTSNIAKLTQAWVYHMSPARDATRSADPASSGSRRHRSTTQATPLVVNDMMYLATPYSSVIALKPETGELIWTV
jgi:quinoprotein glucose dehydrogenase